MSKVYPLLISGMLLSCGSENPLTPSGYVPKFVPKVNQDMPDLPEDTDLKLIVNEFYSNAQVLEVEVARDVSKVKFEESYSDDEEGLVVGRCEIYYYADGTVSYKEVSILRPDWDKASIQRKRTLIYHELGHCALNLDHTDNPDSIMYPTLLLDWKASKEWFILVKNLFASES